MITTAELAGLPLFAALSHAQRSRVAARAADVRANAGEWIAHAGDPSYFWVVLEGEVEAVRMVGSEERRATTFDAGEYFGEVPLILGTTAFVGIRALQTSRLARIDPADFHALLSDSPEVGALLVQSLVRRVNWIKDAYASASTTQATIVGFSDDFACHDVRDFLSRNQIAFEWLDPRNPGDAARVPPSVDSTEYPAVVFADGSVLKSPSLRELAERLNLQTEPGAEPYDVVIIGGGPAGLAAAVYGGSEGLRTVMIEREAPGGQAGTSSRIENYLGFPGGISGGELANRAYLQARRFGTDILVTRSVTGISSDGAGHRVHLDGDAVVSARAVVIATGVAWRKLDSAGAEALTGRGVYYGAARTEALATRDKEIFLIGGGNSAGQAAMFFSNYARRVTLLVRGSNLERSMSFYLIEQLRSKANIAVETDSTVVEISGNAHLEAISVKNAATGVTTSRPADAIFSFIGADAETSWLPEELERDERGFIRTGRDIEGWTQSRTPYQLETSVPGIFAAGDVRSNSVKRVASGVGEGSMVIAFIHEYLANLSAIEKALPAR